MHPSEAERVRPAFETAVLLTSVVALLLPTGGRIIALVGLILLWLAARPVRQERVFVAALGLATGLLLAAEVAQRARPPLIEDWRGEVEAGFAGIRSDLRQRAESAAASFPQAPEEGEASRRDFELLQAEISDDDRGVTLLLIAPSGSLVAWAGEGLVHEPNAFDLPSSGFGHRRGYASATVFAIAPLSSLEASSAVNPPPEDARSWRVVAGRSLSTNRLPFPSSASARPPATRWTVAAPDSEQHDNALKWDFGDRSAVFVDLPESLEHRAVGQASLLRRLGIGLVGLTLLALTLLRSAGGLLLPEETTKRPTSGLPLLALAGAAALGSAAQFQNPLTAAFALAVGLATWGLTRRRSSMVRSAGGAWRGAASLVALTFAAYAYQRWTRPEDLAAGLVGSVDSFALCLVWCLAALGLLALAAPGCAAQASDRAAWWATLLLLAAGASCDYPWLAVPLLAISGIAIFGWIGGVDFGRRPTALAALLVLASLAGSVAWEIAYREVFRRQLQEVVLPSVAPPTDDELNDLHVAIYESFDDRDFADLVEPSETDDDPRGLAFVLWRDSPLPQLDALSALAIETRDGQRGSFSFGLALDENFELVLPPERWNVPAAAPWNSSMILGEVEITVAGLDWGVVSYWLLPRPGFRLPVNELGELEESLLRGSARKKVLDGLPRGVLYGLYDLSGRAISSPWGEAPPLDPSLLDADRLESGTSPDTGLALTGLAGSVATPSGRSWVWCREARDGIAALYLPHLTPRAGLERVGTHALGSLTWVVAIAFLAFLFALPGTALRNLFKGTVRSYSKRMILVYALLLLLPLIALNLVLLQSFSDRQRRQQLTNAQSALSSARVFLLDYLQGLERGFDLHTQVNGALLLWISSVVEHPVSVYWGSSFFASSQDELFTLGLLPKRIPGEIFSRLSLSDYKMGFRQRRGGEVDYLELYAPLEIGAGNSSQGLFLSVPLLKQEAGVAREVAALKRRALLVTSALVLLLFAVGSRLARSFTKPIMELIEGTRRIAAGAPFLDVTPREHELEALADAIDAMARRLAEGRRKLVLEKQVVERIVANITSGVVSLDHQRRVLLQNRVASDLLGSDIGHEIEDALEKNPRLKSVKEFIASSGSSAGQETLSLRDEAGEAREWTLTWVPIPGAENPAALLVVDDATEVLRGQRLEAWAEMARIIAHEIKNPLTPIRLSAEHMRQVYRVDRERFDEVFERCTSNILKQVEELADIASDFSIYSRIPRAVLTRGDLVASLRELVDGYRDAARSGVEIRFKSRLDELEARFDPKLLLRAVRNVVENALRASDGRGEVELSIEADAETAWIRVSDSGPGVDPELLRGIFEPYFSTYESGTGLGLAITRRIVEEHHGVIEASNRSSGGLEVEITIPRVLQHLDGDEGSSEVKDPRPHLES